MGSAEATTRPTRARWMIVGMVFLVYVLMFIDRVNISIAAQYIMPEYGITDVQMGWIFSAFVLGYAVMQLPGGWLGDRFGPRRILTWAILWWSSLTAATTIAGEIFLTSLVGTVGSFCVLRALIGIGEATALPNGSRILANWIPSHERGLALGISISGVSVGAAITPPLITWMMVTWGWREAFFAAGGIGVFLAVLWYRLVTDQPASHHLVNTAELRLIGKETSGAADRAASPEQVPWRTLFGCADLWLITISFFTFGYILYIYYSWFYLYLVSVRGFSVVSGGGYTMAPFVAGGIAAPIGGWMTDNLSRRFGKRIGRCGIGFGGLFLSACFIAAGAAVINPEIAVLSLSLGAGMLFLSAAAYWATAVDLGSTYAGTVSGFLNTGANVGGVLSPIITPALAQHIGWESALYVAAALVLIGAFLWLAVHPERAMDLSKASKHARIEQKDMEVIAITKPTDQR